MPTPPLPEFDASAAAAAYDKLKSRLAALSEPAPARPDVRPVIAVALQTHQDVQPLRERLAKLPKEEFDASSVDAVKDGAWALWHARAELDKALAPPANLELPAPLSERAATLKERMLRVSKYWLEDDAQVAPVLSSIARKKSPGPGEIASDLRRLATVYREKKAVIAADVKHYRAEDADDAEKAADEIGKLLSSIGADAIRTWTVELARAQAFLFAQHDELRAAALFLLRKEPGAAEKFPALSTLPAPRGRKPKVPGAPPSEPPPAAS